jgi:hypothetical protein
LNPDDGLTHFDFASFLVPSNPAGAVSHFRTGLRLQPDNRFAANNLAWLLATHPDERIRKPAEALEMVTKINQETGGQIPNILDTLAAAQAATGDFKAAAATAGRALALPGTAQNPQLAAALKERLTLYQKGKPFRVAAPPQGPTP